LFRQYPNRDGAKLVFAKFSQATKVRLRKLRGNGGYAGALSANAVIGIPAKTRCKWPVRHPAPPIVSTPVRVDAHDTTAGDPKIGRKR
jgi:hypothetical protein